MRRFWTVIAVLVAICIAAVVIFAATFDINRYRGTIQAQLTQHLGRDVSLGTMRLNWLPPRFVVDNVAIADDPRFETHRPFVQAQQLDISIKLLPLLHKDIEIDSLALSRPAVELVKNAQGIWNFASLGSNSAPATQAPTAPNQQQFSLSKLAIQDGQVAMTDEQAHQPRAVYDHIDVTLRDFAPNQPFSLDAAAHLPGAAGQAITLQGQGGPVRQDQPGATPFHGTLNLQQVQISGARRFLNSPALAKTDGTISGQTKIASDGGKLSADGAINIQNVKLNGQDFGYPISLQYNVKDDVPADLLMIDNANLKLGNTPISISGTVNSKSTPAEIDLRAKANNVSVAEAAKLAAQSGAALRPGATMSGTVDANVELRGAADNPALKGNITAHDLQVSGKDIPQPVQVKSIVLWLNPNEIHSDPFTVSSGGTSANVRFVMNQYLSKNPTVDAMVKAANAQLPALLAMAKAYGVTALDPVNGSGTLNLDLHAAGPVRAAASGDLASALNGTVNMNFQDVKYSGADISHELTAIAGVLGLHQSNQGYTTINKMTGDIAIKNGIAQTTNAEALLDIGNLGIAGTANLVNQALNLKVTAVLSSELSQKAGGTNVGGYAKTVLANSQGELVIPAMVTGTFQHPRFTPDVQQLAQMKLKGLIPNFNNPGSAVSGLLGGLLGKQQGTAQSAAGDADRQAQPNPLDQLRGLFGKKKQQQPPQK